MPDTRDLVEQVAQGIAASGTTSPTRHGQSDARAPVSGAQIEAINQVFALFRLNYHNQYYAAFPDAEQLKQIKKLWLETLQGFPVEQVLRGARHAIETSEYLPTLHRMLVCCQQSWDEHGLPTDHDAYVEACNAATPKSAQAWSHAAVYLAGRDSDWFFLASRPENVAFPVYREHYQRYCARALRGERLEVPAPEALEKPTPKPLTREEQLARLRALRESTGL